MATQLPSAPVTPSIIGWIIALLVLVVVVVLAIIGQIETKMAFLIGGLALARLI